MDEQKKLEFLPFHDLPDINLVHKLYTAKKIAVALILSISVIIFLAWYFPMVAEILPYGWEGMQVTTALSFLCIGFILTGRVENYTLLRKILNIVLCLFVLSIGASTVYLHTKDIKVGVANLIMTNHETPSIMSMQTALFFSVISLMALLVNIYKNKNSITIDLLLFLLAIIPVSIFAGYIFYATDLFKQSAHIYSSIQTMLCMFLSVMILFVMRINSYLISPIFSSGIGSVNFRVRVPIVILCYATVIAIIFNLISNNTLPLNMGIALIFVAIVTISILVGIISATTINNLERQLVDLSLRDELTGLYNFRAFGIIGEHMFFQAKRSRQKIVVFFFDIDGLKLVNDNLGHDTGSQLLKEFANALIHTFRSEDLVARFGGDEFIALIKYHENLSMLDRLQHAVDKINEQATQYRIKYSCGFVISEPSDTFEQIISKADQTMYENKNNDNGKDVLIIK